MNIKHLKEPYVIILIGPPNSGKDTYIKEHFSDKDVTVISRDQILLDIYGSDNYDEAYDKVNHKLVDITLHNALLDASKEKKNVIVNMTHMTPKRRKYNLSYFGKEYYKIAVIFPILDWDEYIRRNEIRSKTENKTIPEKVLKDMISSYKPVTKEEGFNKIISI